LSPGCCSCSLPVSLGTLANAPSPSDRHQEPTRAQASEPDQLRFATYFLLHQLKCREWLGWAAAAATSGTAWLKPRVIDCPTARDTSAYLSIRPAERLACVGDDEWVLRAYAAPLARGRGCLSTWFTNPRWLDGSCNFFFPQPVASETDDDSRLQSFLDPTLGSCQSVEVSPCSYDGLVGVWIQMVGHLDDPRARDCVADPVEEYSAPLPDPERVVFDCRLRLVVTEITESTAP
jgi:hypothetical protein